jgi:hypothetical protein
LVNFAARRHGGGACAGEFKEEIGNRRYFEPLAEPREAQASATTASG